MKKRIKQTSLLIKKNIAKGALLLFSSFGLANLSLPAVVLADVEPFLEVDQAVVLEFKMELDALQNQWRKHGEFPKSEMAEPRHFIEIPITAYSSDVWQTDSTPFITASMTRVRDGVVAANFLPIGTRVRLPDLYGDKIFIVEDRMNQRYYYHLDIWMSERVDAVNFGLQHTRVEIF